MKPTSEGSSSVELGLLAKVPPTPRAPHEVRFQAEDGQVQVRPVGHAPDGLLEAAEGEDGWLVAVQWHPEHTAERDATQQSLFDGLAAAAASFASSRGA